MLSDDALGSVPLNKIERQILIYSVLPLKPILCSALPLPATIRPLYYSVPSRSVLVSKLTLIIPEQGSTKEPSLHSVPKYHSVEDCLGGVSDKIRPRNHEMEIQWWPFSVLIGVGSYVFERSE